MHNSSLGFISELGHRNQFPSTHPLCIVTGSIYFFVKVRFIYTQYEITPYAVVKSHYMWMPLGHIICVLEELGHVIVMCTVGLSKVWSST